MTAHWYARLAWLLSLLSVLFAVLVAAAGVLMEDTSNFPQTEPGMDPTQSLSALFLVTSILLVYALVGGLISTRRPGNLVAATLLFNGSATLAMSALGTYGQLAVLAEPDWGLPAGAAVVALTAPGYIPMLAGVFALIVIFPSGLPRSQGMRYATSAVLLGFALLWFATVLSQDLAAPFQDVTNPFALGHGMGVLADLLLTALVIATIIAAIAMVLRFRRSRGDERQQFKWLAIAGALLVIALPIGAVDGYSGIAGMPLAVALMALPLSIAVAVLKYRLYDIDGLINRTLVYGLLTAILGTAYFVLVVTTQALLRPFSGGSDLAIALTTLVIAASTLPLRGRIQLLVDRHFNRRHYDATQTLDRFSARLREHMDIGTLTVEMAEVLSDTLEPSRFSLWLKSRNDFKTP